MDIEEAEIVLKDWINEDGLYCGDPYLTWSKHTMSMTIDGDLTADQMIAVGVYMKHHKTYTECQ